MRSNTRGSFRESYRKWLARVTLFLAWVVCEGLATGLIVLGLLGVGYVFEHRVRGATALISAIAVLVFGAFLAFETHVGVSKAWKRNLC